MAARSYAPHDYPVRAVVLESDRAAGGPALVYFLVEQKAESDPRTALRMARHVLRVRDRHAGTLDRWLEEHLFADTLDAVSSSARADDEQSHGAMDIENQDLS